MDRWVDIGLGRRIDVGGGFDRCGWIVGVRDRWWDG